MDERSVSIAPLWCSRQRLSLQFHLHSISGVTRSRAMLSVRACLAGAILTTALLGACQGGPPITPAVGVAYPSWAAGFIQLAESALRADWGDTAAVPRFILDPDRTPERIERTVEWTQQLLRAPGVSIIV